MALIALAPGNQTARPVDNRKSGRYDVRMETNAPAGDVPREWLEEFEAAARRPLPLRWRYAFIHTYKPVMDDATFRAFDTMEDYRRWCEQNLPDWLGYARV